MMKVNSVTLTPEDEVELGWFRLLYLDHPVTRTEVCLYMNEQGFDVVFTGSITDPTGYYVWIKTDELKRATCEHMNKFTEWWWKI